MPTYQYACTACEHRFEAVQTFTDITLTECPECTGRVRKVFSSVGIVFKGSGFYRTDSRSAPQGEAGSSGSSEKSEKSEKPKKSEKSESKSGSKSSDSSSSSSSTSSPSGSGSSNSSSTNSGSGAAAKAS